MQKFFCLFILLLAGALSAAGTAPRLNEFGALELDGTSWLVTFVNKSWTAFSYDGRWRDAVFHRREGGTDSAAFRVTIPDFPAGELKLALTPEGESFRYRADVSFTEPAELASLSLETRLPVKEYAGNTLKIDGKPFMLPREEQKGLIVHRRAAGLQAAELYRADSTDARFRQNHCRFAGADGPMRRGERHSPRPAQGGECRICRRRCR